MTTIPLQTDLVAADPALERVLQIARHIGVAGQDEVNISYTSLFIGLLWSGDPTSQWLDEKLEQLGARRRAVYAQRRMEDTQRAAILDRADRGEQVTSVRDDISVSARTVLSEARSLATEAGLPPGEPLGTRHVAAVYFFRNPPGHNPQFHAEWGFEKELWRQEFALFIATGYPLEAPAWSQVLAGYMPNAEPESRRLEGRVLADFRFEAEAIGVLRSLELLASKSPPLMTSGGLLQVLASARSLPDCAAFADLTADRLEVKGTIVPPAQAAPFEGTGSAQAVSRGLKNVLDRARSLARSTTSRQVIGLRHLIASILVDPDSTANQKLVKAGLSLPLLREKMLKTFIRRWLDDDGMQWQLLMVGSTLPTIVEIYPDSAERGEDRLDVGRYARAFATVIAAERVNPPFSIGIFGDWGSGKSFFMRLMSEQTERLSALTDVGGDGKRLFCERVVSIRFNAWHYAEGELLASLVQTILEGLRKAIVGNEGDSALMDAVLAKLEIAKVARGEAEAELSRAVAEQEIRKADLEAARKLAERKAEAIPDVGPKDIVAAVRTEPLPGLRMNDALVVAEDYLGVKGLQELKASGEKTAGDLMGFINDAQVVAARAKSTWEWLLRAPVNWAELCPWFVGLSLVLVLTTAAAIRYRESWPAFSGLALNLLGIVALGARWARRHLRTVSSGLDQFDEVRRRIDGALAAKRSQLQAEVAEAEEEHRKAVAEQQRAQAQLAAAEAKVAKAEQEVEESRSINQMAKLLDDRLTRKSYQRYLGIVAAVRIDFQRLSDLMKSLRADPRANGGKLKPVDRIVLYIDDLDRCPSAQVVAVLEAIHLLLTFELFVVVVGVDVRWAARSLVEKYPRHLSVGVYQGGDDQATDVDGVSALDYLEKIFQVPFWLPPMEEDCSRNMIAEMVPRVAVAGAAEEVPSGEDAESRTAGGDGPDSARAVASERSAGEAATSAKSLVIEAEERNFMLQLAGAVGKSPRRLKRFVNTYRILKASLDNLQQETFVVKGGSQGEYRAAMTLLAMITAAPRSSLGILKFLTDCDEAVPLTDFEAHIKTSPDQFEARYALTALQAYRDADQGVSLKLLRHWAPLVARFSFRSGRA
jgi:hypothetical protein